MKYLIYLSGVTFPFYISPPGFPQPTNIILLISSFLIIFFSKLKFGEGKYSVVLVFLFLCYSILVSSIWVIITNDIEMIKYPIFYIYNFLIFVSIISFLSNTSNSSDVLLRYLLISVISTFVLTVVTYDPNLLRQKGGFNNPNQLGFASLMLASCLYVLLLDKLFTKRYIWAFFLCFICSVLSFSLTSIVSVLTLFIVVNFIPERGESLSKTRKIISLTSLFFGFLFIFLMFSQFDSIIDAFNTRLSLVDRKIAEAYEVRGYSRLVDFYDYLYLGAAEGGFERFNVHNFEIHSMFAGVLFSYGFPGFIIFSVFLISIFYRLNFKMKIIFMLPLLYSLTHFILRDTNVWFFWALCAVASTQSTIKPRISD